MALFKRKSVKDYLNDDSFQKEYELLLKNRKEENKKIVLGTAHKKELYKETPEPSPVVKVEEKQPISKQEVTELKEEVIEIKENKSEANEISKPKEEIIETQSLPNDRVYKETIFEAKKSKKIVEKELSLIAEEDKEKSFFKKLVNSLGKTKNSILGKLNNIISGGGKIDDDTLDDLEEALYTSDLGVKTTELVIENIRKRVKKENPEDKSVLIDIVKEELTSLVKFDNSLAEADFKQTPYVILVVGVNGNGKTTTIGKMAHYYRNMGKKVVIGAADTFRAAAIEQLEIWANRAKVDFISQTIGSDPAAVAYNSYQASIDRDADILLIDTAGRLHNKVNLMKELEKISRVLKKFDENAPHEVLLVLDATTGQNAVSQARQFNSVIGIDGLVLTKLDGTAKGGVAIAINQELDIPVKFIGVGEKLDDLQVFDVQNYVKAMFE